MDENQTWEVPGKEAPVCAQCAHCQEKPRRLFTTNTDRFLCAHPFALHKITGEPKPAAAVRFSVRQDLWCGVQGKWYAPKTAANEAKRLPDAERIMPCYALDRPAFDWVPKALKDRFVSHKEVADV